MTSVPFLPDLRRMRAERPARWRPATSRKGLGRLTAAALMTCFALLVLFSALPVDIAAQQLLGTVLVLLLLVLSRLPRTPAVRVLFLATGAVLTLRYFFWRTTFTVVFQDVPSFIFTILLYLAELYGITLYLVSLFVNVTSLERRPVPVTGPPDQWPTVDVMVPSYNEDPELLEVTLLAALQMRYPRDRFKVFLLDDGGTKQKREQEDPVKAEEALERHRELQRLCRQLGCLYRTREKNVSAKAGNINAALLASEQSPYGATDGELILILDADHVPAKDFLEKSVGAFQRDPKLFLLQTPHFFLNPDPIEKNLGTFHTMPSENEMFYGVIQRGLDFWNGAFFCGSAALLRRQHLEEIGGISGISITEDAETALELHARGYRSAYLDEPLIAGLQPETFGGFVVQRTRWAQGMVQIFLLRNPLLKPGLTPVQRLGYFNSSFFWFFAFARAVFLIAPACFLIFGMQIYRANLAQFLGYAMPHLIGAVLVSGYLFGRVRWTLFSELYETMQSLFCLRGLVQVALSPRSPSFGVTPKGEHLEKNFISPFAPTFYFLFLLTLVSLVFGVYRYQVFQFERGVVVVTMAWALFNLLLLIAALGAVYEQAQRRKMPRVPLDLPARVAIDGVWAPCRTVDGSVDGVAFRFGWEDSRLLDARRCELEITSSEGVAHRFQVQPRNFRYPDKSSIVCGARFLGRSLEERRAAVDLIYGDSERWRRMLGSRRRSVGILHGAFFLLARGSRFFALHLLHLVGATPIAVARQVLLPLRPWIRRFPLRGTAF